MPDVDNFSHKTHSSALWIILLVSLIVRIAAVPLVHSSGYTSDEREYIAMAERILQGDGFIDTNGAYAVRAPLFPALLALVFGLSGYSLVVAHAAQCLCGVLVVYLVYRLTCLLVGDRTTALNASIVAALYPGMIIYSALLQTEMPYCCFVLAAFGLVYAMVDGGGGISKAAMMGLWCGLASLTRAVFLGFAPLLIAATAWMARWNLRKSANNGLVVLAALFVVVAPWTLRNYLLFSALVPVGSGAGDSFLTGNNPYATGTWRVLGGFEEWRMEQSLAHGLQRADSLDEVHHAAVSGILAREYIISHPGEIAALVVKKTQIFWIYPIDHNDESRLLQLGEVLIDALLYVGVILGLVVAPRPLMRRLTPLIGACFFFWLTQVVLHSEARFRLPLIPILALFWGIGASNLANSGLKRFFLDSARRTWLLVGTGMVVLIYGATGWMFLHGMIQ